MPPSTSLADHLAKLRAKRDAAPTSEQSEAILFWGTHADNSYLPILKGCVGSTTVYLRNDPITMIGQVALYCASKKVTKVLSTSVPLLQKLLKWDKRKAPSMEAYSGSYFTIPTSEGKGQIEVVFTNPLKQLATKTYGKLLTARNVSKLTKPDVWFPASEFTGFTILTPANEAALFLEFSTASLICVDIETFRENAVIRCLSYTYAKFTSAGLVTKSVVLPMTDDYELSIMRKWNWHLKAPKIFQNGKYDISYFARYSAPINNYLYDTATLFHCWYAELPKDLGFLNAFFIRKAMYWKDLAETNDLYEYYRYNALDTWGTLNCFLAMLLEAPEFAMQNYLLEFPLTFPCHLSEMTGVARDMDAMTEAHKQQTVIVNEETAKLNTLLAIPKGQSFNVKSPPQMKSLLKLLGCSDLPSTDEKNLKKARFRHPLNARIISSVLKVRKARTLLSNYLTAGKEFTRQDGTGHRFLYSLNPHGTDSSRLASKSHHFWCGDNIQKIPRGPIVKQTFKADPGFYLAECDLEQAESRDTAYISGDETLIHNVEYSPDFHCSNAASFFGVPFDALYDVTRNVVLNKELRNLGKPINHGANYNMGAYVLIDTMGEEMIIKAKLLLKLPVGWGYVQVAEHLLAQFHKTYPDIKGVFYPGVVDEILTTRKLTSLAVHWSPEVSIDKFKELKDTMDSEYAAALDTTPRWTRYCFGSPEKNKSHLNSYISHPPQSLNAQTLNKAYLHVFHKIAMNPIHSNNFKLCAQIHDSILFQYRIGHDYLCDLVEAGMEIPLTVRAYDGKVRSFIVPAGVKRGQHLKGENKGKAVYWSQTE